MGKGKGPLGAEQLWEGGKGRLGQSGGKSVLGKKHTAYMDLDPRKCECKVYRY